MAINCYSGLQGSGKSYEVTSSVVVPAIAAGRRVVTNISGMDNDGIRAYCCEKFGVALEDLGSVLSVSNAQVEARDFFPCLEEAVPAAPGRFSQSSSSARPSVVQPGDLVAIDEAYKIWGSDCKIHDEHKVFFREHRHYAHPDTGVTCDLVLMTQDIGDLHRILKVVIEQSFKCHKAKGVGLNSTYTITMWEGWKQAQKTIVKDWTQRYNPEIFPLYKSYSGESQGKETSADGRQNVFGNRASLYKILALVAIFIFILWRLGSWWWGKVHPEGAAVAVPGKSAVVSGAAVAPRPSVSAEWRIAGELQQDGRRWILLVDGSRLRLVDPLMFIGAGLLQSGTVEDAKVTRFSGRPIVESSGGGPKL